MLAQLITLIIKELQALLRNTQTRTILIMPVLVQITLFPLAATLDVTNTTLAVYNEDNGDASIELTQRLAKSQSFQHVLLLHSQQEIQQTIDEQQALLVVRFPIDFSRQLAQGETAQLQLILDGRRSNSAQIAANYVQNIVQQYSDELRNPALNPSSIGANSQLLIRHQYNPNLNYRWFILPSLIAMITTIGVMIVTSLSIAQERELGTLDQLLVSPLVTWQIFAGKAVPALIIATGQATIVLLAGILAYRIPFAGSLALFYLSMLIYGSSIIGVGLLISSLCTTQQQAFIGVFVFIMPSILLSGYIAPVENMPHWLQQVTWFNPIRHFIDITKQIYLKGAGFDIVCNSLYPLLLITLITSSIAYWMFRRNIG